MTEERAGRPKKSLVNKLRWPIVISVIIALLLMSYVQIRMSGQAQRRQIYNVQQGTAEEIALSVTAYLQRAEGSLNILAQTQDLLSLERDDQQVILERLLTQQEETYEEITLLNLDGDEIAKVSRFYTYLPEELENRSYTSAFQQALTGEAYLADEVNISPYSSLPTVTIAVPVSDPNSGDVVGVLIADASVKRMWDVVAGARVGETGYAYVVNDEGRLQAHSELAEYLNLRDEDLSGTPAMERVKDEQVDVGIWGGMRGGEGFQLSNLWWILFPPRVWEYTGLSGEEVIGAWTSIEETPWTVIVDLPTAEAYSGLRQMTLTLLGVLGAVVLVIGAVTSLLPQRVIRPLARLEKGANLLSGGHLDHRINLKTEDELESLANAFNEMADRLQELYAGLERRVNERTRDLELRSAYLEASAEVGRAVASMLDVDKLLEEVVDMIRARFGLYYVGLFLVDETGERAVLWAGTGEAGQQMLEQEHQLDVGGQSMIGQCVAQGKARIALDVGEEAVHFDNPLLPETRSEAALPLRSRGQVLGALTVQSVRSAAFNEDVITVLQTMADQVAVALDNARLFAESEQAAAAARRASGEVSREAWLELLSQQREMGFHSDERGVISAEQVWHPEMEQALRKKKIVTKEDGGEKHPLAVPIRVRGEVIGVLDTYKPADAGEWEDEEVEMLKTFVEQLGAALESARLYEDTQRRAAREQLTGQIGNRLRETLDIDAVLATAAKELRNALNVKATEVWIEAEDE